MNLNISYDANTLSSAPANFFSTVDYVVSLFDATFTNSATVNIEIGYGDFPSDGSVVPALGESQQNNFAAVDYAQATAPLIAQGAPGANTLPSTSPIGGVLEMGSAQEKALGLPVAGDSLDGWVGIASNATLQQQTGGSWSFSPTAVPGSSQYYIVGTLEHEISEVMGRLSYLGLGGEYGLMDLYRYAGSGVRQTGTGDPAYFSLDGGATDLASWNNFRISSEDLGDWAPHAGPSGVFTPTGADAFNAFSDPGVINGLSQTDIILMDALGWSPSVNTVAQLYYAVLDRAPDSAGLAFWNAALANGESLQQIRTAFANSAEAQNDLTQLYHQVLGRAPDPGGPSTWTSALANNDALAAVRDAFALSPEAQNDLNGLYQQVLDRAADNGGLATYTNVLGNGGSLAEVRGVLAASPEAQNDINQIYQMVLGRHADSGGLATYEVTLASGWSLDGVRGDMAHSAEAKSDLTRLFDAALGRDPTAAELMGAENTLAQGGSLSGIAGALAGGAAASGLATVAPSAGDSTLSAASGPTKFLFSDVGFGQATIEGFDPSQDAIVLSHTQTPDFARSANAAGTLVTLNPSQSIELTGVTPVSLHPNNFQLV